MNLTVLLIAAFLPLPVLLFMILRSGSFGKGSIGTMLKLFFLGVASAVPAFLMEAGCLLVISVFLGLFPDDAFGGNLPVVSAVLRCFIAAALIEEGWKLFVLRASTWKQMIMENITDGIAASALVGTGFSAVMYGAWQAAYYVIPAHMEILREALPEFLGAGAVTSFLV
ncbi:MAG: PrsW family intramembrane metalloprotease, partial [Oscillospiraceae bacterium]|nr:PrsW family intramembrane metalloprotease [Oscillospiraceae bacterium]